MLHPTQTPADKGTASRDPKADGRFQSSGTLLSSHRAVSSLPFRMAAHACCRPSCVSAVKSHSSIPPNTKRAEEFLLPRRTPEPLASLSQVSTAPVSARHSVRTAPEHPASARGQKRGRSGDERDPLHPPGQRGDNERV